MAERARRPPETRSFKKWIDGGGEEENCLWEEIVRKYFGGEPLPVSEEFLRAGRRKLETNEQGRERE